MRFIKFAVLAALFALPLSSADAGVVGSASFNLSDLTFNITPDGGVSQVATANFIPGSTTADFSISTFSAAFTNSASLNGLATTPVNGSIFVAATPGGGVSVPIGDAFGAAVAGNLMGDFTRSDSSFQDSFADLSTDLLLVGTPIGGDAFTAADFNVDTQGAIGDADSVVNNSSAFEFVSNFDGDLSIDFDGAIDLALNDSGIPDDFFTTADSNFAITAIRNRGGISTTFAIDSSDSAILGQSIQQSGLGSTAFSGSDSFALEFDVIEGDNITFTIQQTSSVSIGQVPEPTSALAFIGIFGFVLRRKRLV